MGDWPGLNQLEGAPLKLSPWAGVLAFLRPARSTVRTSLAHKHFHSPLFSRHDHHTLSRLGLMESWS